MQKLSKNIIENLIRLLKAHFEEIIVHVKENGRWSLPVSVKTELNKLPSLKPETINKIQGSDEVDEEGKKIFHDSAFLLERFCLLKIHELSHVLSKEQPEKNTYPIVLALLERPQGEHKIVITMVEIKFDQTNNIADTIIKYQQIKAWFKKPTF